MTDRQFITLNKGQYEDICREIISRKWGISRPPPVLLCMVAGQTYRPPMDRQHVETDGRHFRVVFSGQ